MIKTKNQVLVIDLQIIYLVQIMLFSKQKVMQYAKIAMLQLKVVPRVKL